MIPEPAGMDDLGQQTRGAAFRLLLETGRAVSATQIAAELKAPIRLQFAAGQPPATPVVVFFPDDRGATRTIDDWCSNANFFPTRQAALSWSAQRKMEGEVIELDEALRRGLANWGPLLSANRDIELREDHGDNG
jgi:hypothetical protein